MEKSLRLFRVPGELDYLASERPGATHEAMPHDLDLRSRSRSDQMKLTATAARRINALARDESQQGYSVVHPSWLDGHAIPRLIISARYNGLDVFGSSRMMARLDLAARRAGALQPQVARGVKINKSPEPLRTHQGGLHLLDVRVGSFEMVTTVWGALVTLAVSSPVAVAGMIALAWDMGRGAVRLANRWGGAMLLAGQDDRPSLEAPESTAPWGVHHTKGLEGVLGQAVENGQGFEFYLRDGEQELKITVPPKERPARDIEDGGPVAR